MNQIYNIEYLENIEEFSGVYILFNAKNNPIYIGSSENVKRRIFEHLNSKKTCFVKQIYKFSFECVDIDNILKVEYHLISRYNPPFNYYACVNTGLTLSEFRKEEKRKRDLYKYRIVERYLKYGQFLIYYNYFKEDFNNMDKSKFIYEINHTYHDKNTNIHNLFQNVYNFYNDDERMKKEMMYILR